MAETRPSGLPVVSGDGAIVTQEIAAVDERGRLHLLPRWVKHVDWLRMAAEAEVDSLLVLVEPGMLSFREWKIDGPRITRRYEEIASTQEVDTLAVLRLIQDRYMRLVIPKDRRPYLGDAALAHLGLPTARGEKRMVYVAVSTNQIDVLSPAYRNAKLISGDIRIDDLP